MPGCDFTLFSGGMVEEDETVETTLQRVPQKSPAKEPCLE